MRSNLGHILPSEGNRILNQDEEGGKHRAADPALPMDSHGLKPVSSGDTINIADRVQSNRRRAVDSPILRGKQRVSGRAIDDISKHRRVARQTLIGAGTRDQIASYFTRECIVNSVCRVELQALARPRFQLCPSSYVVQGPE